MAEFAVVAGLVFLPILFGTIEFGRLMFAKQTVTAAAREGTRKAIVSGSASGTTDAQFAARIDSVVNARAQLDPLKITRTWTGSRDPGDTVKVTVAYTYTPVVKLPFMSVKTVTGVSQQVIVF